MLYKAVTARQPLESGPLVRPTRIRYYVLGLSFIVGLVMFLDRACMGTATPMIMRDFGLDNKSYPTDEDVFREQTMVVKGEDIPMVEAQQANLRRFGAVRDIPTRQDRFITAVHRVLAELYRGTNDAVPKELQRLG